MRRSYPAPGSDHRPREPRQYGSYAETSTVGSSSYRSSGPIRKPVESTAPRPSSSRPKGDLRDMDLQAVILSSRPGARPSRGAGSGQRSRALLDAAMDDYWKQDDDGDAAPVRSNFLDCAQYLRICRLMVLIPHAQFKARTF